MNRLHSGKIIRTPALRRLLAGAVLLAGVSGFAGPAAGMTEADCLAVLTSDAARKDKVDACQELVRVGTVHAVPVLADLLSDEQLAHMARYALEAIPDPAVDAALRKALDQVDGQLRVGVIGSIGVRRDAAASRALAALLGDPDTAVAQAAARALGHVGTREAAAALERALATGAAVNLPAVFEGLLRCAERRLDEGDREPAIAIYDRLRTTDRVPHQVQMAGLRGTVLARGEAGLPLVLEALKSKDYSTVMAAAQMAQELEGSAVTQTLADTLARLPADAQVVLASALGLRHDPAAVPGLLALAAAGEPPARIAAIQAVTEIGDPGIMPMLLHLQSDPEREVAVASQAALAALEGPGVDEALVGLLGQGEVPAQQAIIDLVGQRRVHSAVPKLLVLAREGDASLRADAIQVLGVLAGHEDLPALIGLLSEVSPPGERRAAEAALSALCVRLSRPDPANVTIRKAVYGDLPDGPQRDVTDAVAAMVQAGTFSVRASNGNFGDSAPGIPKKMLLEYAVHGQVMSETVAENQSVEIQAGAAPPAVSDALCAGLSRASGESKLAFLRVLRTAGGDKALAAVRQAMEDTDPDVRAAAASVLAGWPTVDALPELLALATTTTDTRARILALRGAYRLVPLQTVPDARKLAQVKQALDLSDRPDEKRLALSALARIARPASLAVALSLLRDDAIAEEAGLAAVAIAETLAASSPDRASAAARQVLEVARNPQTRTRAQALLVQAQPDDP